MKLGGVDGDEDTDEGVAVADEGAEEVKVDTVGVALLDDGFLEPSVDDGMTTLDEGILD